MNLMAFAFRVAILLVLFLLCQCRCIRLCVNFLKEHSSTGSNTRFTHNIPARPVNFEEFVQSNSRRNLPWELLRKRFDVADADDDGLLTPEEIARHRVAASRNKNKDE